MPSLPYIIKQVELAVRSRLDDQLRPRGVTVVQYTALTVLRQRDGISSAALARKSFVTAQSMSDLVTTLERQQFIVRRRDPYNRRELLISLTEQGRAFLTDCDDSVRELEERMVSALTGDQVGDLRRSLLACRLALTEPTAPGS